MLHPIDGGEHHIHSGYNKDVALKMLATGAIVDEILDWKQRRRAVILAHRYREARSRKWLISLAIVWNFPERLVTSTAM